MILLTLSAREIVIQILVLGILFTGATLLLLFRWHKKVTPPAQRSRPEEPPGSPGIAARLASLEAAHSEILCQIDDLRDSFALEIRELAAVLAERENRMAVSSGVNEQLSLLATMYAQKAEAMEPFVRAIRQLQPVVALLVPFASVPAVREITKEYEALAATGDQLKGQHAALETLRGSSRRAQQSAVHFRAGSIRPHEFLRQVYANPSPAFEDLPPVVEEQERLARLAGWLEERLLNWIDGVSELRDMAVAGSQNEVRDACSRLIGRADEVMQAWDIKLIDVKVGSTLYDSRLHDLAGTLPRTDVVPETVIGVRRLGHKRNGVVVRKPEVLVAAASAAV